MKILPSIHDNELLIKAETDFESICLYKFLSGDKDNAFLHITEEKNLANLHISIEEREG